MRKFKITDYEPVLLEIIMLESADILTASDGSHEDDPNEDNEW